MCECEKEGWVDKQEVRVVCYPVSENKRERERKKNPRQDLVLATWHPVAK